MMASSRIPDAATATEASWALARRREAIIRPLADCSPLTIERVDEAAQALTISRSFAYRLLERYRRRPQTSSLLPRVGGRAPRARQLDRDLESLVATTIETFFLTEQRPRLADLQRAVTLECRQQGLRPPSYRTLKRRVDAIDRKLVVARRLGLLRARMAIKPRVGPRLPDGSRLIQVAVRDKGARAYRILRWLDLREIRVQVGRGGHRPQTLRLWTSLMDPSTAPARELAELYARRWEHELYYRELKHHLRRTELLQSHTVETGAQELAALVWAGALVARERARAAGGDVPVLRVSFIKVLQVVQSLWLFFGPFDDLMTDDLKDRIIERGDTLMGTYVTAKRRSRSCPRAVRQPVTGWPRLLRNESIEGPIHLKVL
jgi:hypothetical protein